MVMVVVVALSGFRLVAYVNRDSGGDGAQAIPVTVTEVTQVPLEEVLTYQGAVAPVTIEQVSFKSTGRLASLEGEVGALLTEGHVLAALATEDLQVAVDGAIGQRDGARANLDRAVKGTRPEDIALAEIQVSKAREAVTYLTDKVADVSALWEQGTVSQSELEGLQLELTMAKEDLTLARTKYEKAVNGTEGEVIAAARANLAMADANLAGRQSLLEDATYTLDGPAVLTQTFYEIGELVPAGHPVAILRSEASQVTLGVSGKDLATIYLGQKARIEGNGRVVDGTVVRIAEIPDQNHFLYEVEVGLASPQLPVGTIVTTHLILGEKKATQVPVSAIQNDGIDYVYVVVDDRATLRKIQVTEVKGGVASVTGLSVGEKLIADNLNRIHEGTLVKVGVQP